MSLRKVIAASVFSLIPVMASCSKENEPSPMPPQVPSTKSPSDPAAPSAQVSGAQGKGTITGKVVFKGKHAAAKLSVSKDKEVCGNTKADPAVTIASDGGLKNAVVQIAGLREGKTPVKEAELDQVKCEYVPHVLVIPTGATLKIKNDDGILHNVHTVSKQNTPFNRAQPKFLKEISETFGKPEIVQMRCDVHGWMSGWVVVTDNAFYDVSRADGGFRLDGVLAGKYNLEIWHEVFGKATQEIELKAGEVVNVTFEFHAKAN
jgi:plastocyanin